MTNGQQVFRELRPISGPGDCDLAALEDLSLVTAESFHAFETMLIASHTGWHTDTRTAWEKAFESPAKGICDEERFVKQCEAMGYEDFLASCSPKTQAKLSKPLDIHGREATCVQPARHLFRLLRPESGRPDLAYSDLWPRSIAERKQKGSRMGTASTSMRSPNSTFYGTASTFYGSEGSEFCAPPRSELSSAAADLQDEDGEAFSGAFAAAEVNKDGAVDTGDALAAGPDQTGTEASK